MFFVFPGIQIRYRSRNPLGIFESGNPKLDTGFTLFINIHLRCMNGIFETL